MKVRTEGRKAFLHMMFTTALEGGIGYWSVADEYHWQKDSAKAVREAGQVPGWGHDDIDGFYAILLSSEDDWGVSHLVTGYGLGEAEPIRLDIDVMERGVNLLVDLVVEATKSEDPDAPFSRKYLRQFVVQWLTDGDDGDSDADVADMVVQLGLFGEVVYG